MGRWPLKAGATPWAPLLPVDGPQHHEPRKLDQAQLAVRVGVRAARWRHTGWGQPQHGVGCGQSRGMTVIPPGPAALPPMCSLRAGMGGAGTVTPRLASDQGWYHLPLHPRHPPALQLPGDLALGVHTLCSHLHSFLLHKLGVTGASLRVAVRKRLGWGCRAEGP